MRISKDSCNVKFFVGERFLLETFANVNIAHAAVNRVVGKDDHKWEGKTKITFSKGSIESDWLEEIMDSEPEELPYTQNRAVSQLLGVVGHDQQQVKNRRRITSKGPAAEGEEITTINEISERNGWNASVARAALRRIGEQKPYRWAGRDVAIIEEKLRKALRRG